MGFPRLSRRHRKEGPFDPPGLGPATIILLIAVGSLANLWALRTVIQPAYAPVVEAASAAPAAYHFGPDVELVDARVTPSRVVERGSIEVDLSWRAARTVNGLWSVNLVALGDDGKPLAKATSWPEGGRAPTIAWRPGEIYHDHYVLGPISASGEAHLVPIWLNLFDARHPDTPSLAVTDAKGAPVGRGLLLGQVKLLPVNPVAATPSHPVDASFGDAIDLVGYDAGVQNDALALVLYWRDRQTVQTSYTAFVHVVDARGRIVAQGDGIPRGGAYPTTAWDAGETVRDARSISLASVPPGRYSVLVGLYDARSGARLAARTDGPNVSDNAVKLLEFTLSSAFGQVGVHLDGDNPRVVAVEMHAHLAEGTTQDAMGTTNHSARADGSGTGSPSS